MCACERHWSTGAPCTCTCNHGGAPRPPVQAVPDPQLYVNADRTVLLTVWPSGEHEIATRSTPTGTWGPPVSLAVEPPFVWPSSPSAAEIVAQAIAEVEA